MLHKNVIPDLPRTESLPALIIDMDALDRNIDRISECALNAKKNLRIASKSLRIPGLYRYIQNRGGSHFKGILCYSAHEAVWLYNQGYRDLLLAYPIAQFSDFAQAVVVLEQDPTAIIFMVDSPRHLELLASWRKELRFNPKISIAFDIDVSSRFLGFHFGVQRSSLRSIEAIDSLLSLADSHDAFSFQGAMGYEAQISGLPDKNPFSPLLNPIKRWLKKKSALDVFNKREEIFQYFKNRRIELKFFNGGGSGSLTTTSKEPWLTEMTAGSGFFQSHLFDYYEGAHGEPAIFFALRVTRAPEAQIVTAHGGGFIGSGEIGPEKAPIAVLPVGLQSIKQEGFGEVQSPFSTKAVSDEDKLRIGDGILVRPAKTGEIAERFNEVLLVRSDKVIGYEKTYRGLNQCFH